MKCFKCNGELPDNSKFCRHCGQNLNEEATQGAQAAQPAQAAAASQAVANQVAAAKDALSKVDTSKVKATAQKCFYTVKNKATQVAGGIMKGVPNDPTGAKTKKLRMIMAGGAGVVVVVVAVAAIALNTPEAKVLRAINSTSKDVVSELSDYADDLYLISYFSDLDSAEYSFEVEMENYWSTIELLVESDLGSDKLKIEPSVYGYDMTVLISDKYITVEADDMLDDVYGIDIKNLEDDLLDCEWLDWEDIGSDVFDFDYEKVAKNVEDIVSTNMTKMIKSIEVEKESGKESLRINGTSINASAYSVYLDADDVEKYLEACVDDLADDDLVVEYIEMLCLLNGGYYDADDIFDDLYDQVADFADAYDDVASDIDCILYIYGGRVVGMLMEYDREELLMTLNPKGNVLEYVALEADGFEVVFESILEDNVFEAEITVSYGYGKESIGVEYDMDSSRKNLVFTDGSSEYVLTVDGTTKNALSISGEIDGLAFVIESEKNNLDKDWFEQDDDFVNVLTLDEDDFYDEIYYMMYYLF